MASRSGLRAAGAGVLVLTCGLAAGCASPPTRPLDTPPPVVVPGVVPAGTASPGAPGSSPGAAGSRGVVTLGAWAPGGAANPVVTGAVAYFRWLNAHGGVYGRAVAYRVLDDHGSARIVPSLMHRLVQGESVFAIFGAQGVQGSAVTSFLDLSGVPDVFAGPGCGCTGVPARLTDVFGWAPGGLVEAKVLGAWAAQEYAGQKVAVAYAPGASGRTSLAAFATAAHGVRIAARISMASASAVADGVRAAKASGARVLVAFTPPDVVTAASQAMATQRWQVPLAAGASGLATGLPNGVITDGFLPTAGASAHGSLGPAAPTWVALFRKIRNKYLPHTPFSQAMIDGMSSAYEMAQALLRAGPNLTRPGLIAALNGMAPGPVAAPLALTTQNHSGAQGGYVGVLRGGVLVPLTKVWLTSATTSGPVTPYAGVQVVAPANGMPQP